jgi:hypothetical protein
MHEDTGQTEGVANKDAGQSPCGPEDVAVTLENHTRYGIPGGPCNLRDIMPYTQEEAKKLGKVLCKMGVRTFGPVTGQQLLLMVRDIDKVLAEPNKDWTPEMVAVLLSVRARIMDVALLAAFIQAEVIEDLSRLIAKGLDT